MPETKAWCAGSPTLVTDKFTEMDQTIALKNARRDDEALALFRTNRGKALMDEANVFLSGIIRAADERLTAGIGEQRANAAMLRWVSIVGGIVICWWLAASSSPSSAIRANRQARDEVRALNTGLEERVKQRTADLARARDRAECCSPRSTIASPTALRWSLRW